MGLFSVFRRLAGTRQLAADEHSRFMDPGESGQPNREGQFGSPAARKDLLRTVLQTTLARSGIPATWIGADALGASSPGRGTGLHVRFTVRHWDPRLMLHTPAFQNEFEQRLLGLDPQAAVWMRGFSWQFALPSHADYPGLPNPGSWTAKPRKPQHESAPESPDVDDPFIAGPVFIRKPAGTSRPRHTAAPQAGSLSEDPHARRGGSDWADDVTTEPAPLGSFVRSR